MNCNCCYYLHNYSNRNEEGDVKWKTMSHFEKGALAFTTIVTGGGHGY